MSTVLTYEARLERTENSTPWGFRMQGGKDFSSPLAISRVVPASLADKCSLQAGDIILRIGNISTDGLKHKDAQSTIIQSGNRLDLLIQRGGTGGYDKYTAPQINTGTFNDATTNSPSTLSPSQQNFNSAPRPFGSSAPPAPSYVDGKLSQQTKNMSLANSQPASKPAPISYQDAVEKYSERDEPLEPSQHQSKSFKYLQNLMDEGKELNSPLKPVPKPAGGPIGYSNNSNTAQSGVQSVKPPSPTPIGPGSKPGTVKAIVSQRYNNPIGLYSNANVSSQFEGQTKFLIDKDAPDGPAPEALSKPSPVAETTQGGEYDSMGRKKYIPSETYRMVQEESGHLQKNPQPGPSHSKTFKLLQQQMTSGTPAPPVPAPQQPYSNKVPAATPQAYQAPVSKPANAPKPWINSAPPAPVANTTPKPFGAPAQPPPKPSGVGATRGKKGDASMNPMATGRIPVCSSCNMPVRGPFVSALGKTWCPDHFVCANAQCGVKLLDIGFVEENGFLYCEKDYAVHFAPHCDKCGKAIIGECVNAMQKSFHKECFLCAQCHKPIGGNQFHLEEGKFYCETDWNALFQTMCAGCDFPIEPGDEWVEALGKNFHSECFNCTKCQCPLEGQPFVAKGGKPYCKNHAR